MLKFVFNMNKKIRINGNRNIKHNTIKGRVGITDKKNHNVFYVEGGGFITPTLESENFTDLMNNIQLKCKQILKSKLLKSSFLSNDFLMNFEVCSDRMKKDKKTYLSFQYHFKQKNELNKSIIDLKEENENFFIELLNDIEKTLLNNSINISKTK